jgi:hypothetical protein
MTERARRLHATADGQIAELIGLMSTVDQATLRLPCPGRDKLGDGTIGAAARHAADNYRRIATFVRASGLAHGPAGHREHGHAEHGHAERGAGGGQHERKYTADSVDLTDLVDQLSTARGALGHIAELTDSQLDATPPKDSFRFCDGQRSLEQVVASLLKHQGHQVDAIKEATV